MKLAALFALPWLVLAPAALAQPTGPDRFAQCVAKIESDPDGAYEDGMAWAALTHELSGYRCAAMALVAQGHNEEAARRFESLAVSVNSELPALRTELLDQAGNAWLLARDAGHARSAFSRAISTVEAGGVDRAGLPDLLIDRSRAYALEEDWRMAEEDLSRALDGRPNDALALRLRAYARMQQRSFDLAEADAQAAVNLEPSNVDALLMLGHAREAKRTGEPVTPP